MRIALLLTLITACLFALMACGFTPVHAVRETKGVVQLSAIEIVAQPGREGELLKAELQDLLNPGYDSQEKHYRLEVNLQIANNPLVIESDGTASRIRIDFLSPYRLIRNSDNALIHQGALRRTHSYSVSETADYASLIAQRDIIRRGIEALAKDYALRLSGIVSQ